MCFWFKDICIIFMGISRYCADV